MKKNLLVFFTLSFIASAVFADDAGNISRAIPSSKNQKSDTVASTIVSRVATQNDDIVSRNAIGNQTNESVRTSTARSTISRSYVSGNDASGRAELEDAANTVGRSARTQAASMNNNPAVRRAGISLRPSTAEVGGRATIGDTDIQTGSNMNFNKERRVQNRAATESIADATQRLEDTAELNKSCQAQYNECMDQFCSVIDTNQKRCSCSANLSQYTKVATAVKDANSELNDVAQRIRYVGLSADEIRAIMSATEAEQVLDGSKDNTESRNMLEEIEKLIKNPNSAASVADNSSGLDMDLDFAASGSNDLFNLDFLGNNASSFSNLRGTELYNAAKKRCNSVIKQCTKAGATSQQITGNYDVLIDKDCIGYEQGLKKMNDTLVSNVRSANQMLQKARLAVLENKNQYDAKGCVGALNTCMTDEMVCGSDYTKCLDPTKTYIDENGDVVLGQNISNIIAFMNPANYNNAAVNASFLQTAMAANYAQCATAPYNNGSCIAKYLMQKIGTGQTIKNGGLCRAVLDKCQNYSYDSKGVYIPYSEVVVSYVQRAMVNIKAAQQKIIADYASDCMVDIASCYNQQVSQVNAWSSTATVTSIYNVMRGACRNVALTCAYAVFASDTTSCPTAAPDTCINSISQMFYQSLLCPDNSLYQSSAGTIAVNGTVGGYVNERCRCSTGYSVWSGTCSKTCILGEYRSSLGICTSCPIGYYGGGTTSTAPITDKSSCTACANGYTTASTGATVIGQCIAE